MPAPNNRVDTPKKKIIPFPQPASDQNSVLAAEVEEDLRLLRRIAAGEQEAMSRLYQHRGTLLYSLLVRMLGDKMEAQEVVQDTFVRIWKRAGSYDPGRSAPLAWMILIARGLAIDRLRARSRRQASHAAFESEVASIEVERVNGFQRVERVELAGVCRAALRRLPDVQAQALQLAFLRGWTHEEIASAQNEPLGTIKARIRRGLQALRQALGEYRDS